MDTIELTDGGLLLYDEAFLPAELSDRYFLELSDQCAWEQKLGVGNGTLIIMAGTMQQHWKHEVPKTTETVAERINLTFREIVKESLPC